MSRDVRSGRSSRPRHRMVLYFLHRRLWIMECSCKVWCRTCRRRPTPRLHSKLSWRLRLVAFDHRILDEALSVACRQEGEMEQYLEEKKASQKRPATTFQRQDKKKAVYQTQQRSVAVGSTQVPSVRSPGVKKECPHCGKTHGGSECWMITGKCLKYGSSDQKIKDCPRLQQGIQHGAPAPAVVAAAAPATGRPGRPRASARVFALACEDAEQAEHVTEGTIILLGVNAQVLFDTGATQSFISERFAKQLALESGVESEELEVPLSVHTPADRNLASRPLAAKISSLRPAILPSNSLNGQRLSLSSSGQNSELFSLGLKMGGCNDGYGQMGMIRWLRQKEIETMVRCNKAGHMKGECPEVKKDKYKKNKKMKKPKAMLATWSDEDQSEDEGENSLSSKNEELSFMANNSDGK
ncbi:hypothetical protein Taro_049592, partial [Colocasia esculenta]|nr:hypothetical protein [Colocasia esculenta]